VYRTTQLGRVAPPIADIGEFKLNRTTQFCHQADVLC
jgi:hypothetical protein